jgi:hypothetical protein
MRPTTRQSRERIDYSKLLLENNPNRRATPPERDSSCEYINEYIIHHKQTHTRGVNKHEGGRTLQMVVCRIGLMRLIACSFRVEECNSIRAN